MSSLVLSAAEAALNAKTGLSDIDSAGSGNLQGRVVTHWSYYLFIAGSIVGAIAALAGFILSATAVLGVAGYIIGGSGLFLCVTNGFAAFYVKKFGVLNTLEDYTKELSERLKLLASKIFQLTKVNEDLKKINLGLEKIPKDWKEEISKGKKILDQKINELGELTKKLEVAEKKLEAFAKLISVLQVETGEMTKAALEFSKENGFFGEKVEKLSTSVNAFDKENDEFIVHIKELDAQNDQTEVILNSFSKNNQALKDMFNMMQSMYFETKVKVEALKKEIETLKTVVPQAVESTEKMDQISKQYEQMIKGLEVKLEKYKAYKEGYDLWQKWVASQEYTSYLAWRKLNK